VDLHGIAANTKIDGGYVNDYIMDSPSGLHWPLDELSGSYAREVITPTTNGIYVANKTLGDDTFATSKVSRRQYPYKYTAAE
ncbi:hypothetical protein, partial [Vibrio parahaemolyticus]|uniref:hypothetical protein n=1 Tax=Vibrio parahaemolyticus TaxID=670 RepID=UPI0021113AA3